VRCLVVVVACAACGRIDFAPIGDGAGTARRPCGATLTAPDPLTFSGDVFQYMGFQNTRMPLVGATITALAADASALASVTSDASGNYALSFATGGVARGIRLRATRGTYMTTTTYLDTVVDHDIAVFASAQWSFGEAPLWTPGSMGAVYNAAGTTIDFSKSSVNVITEDCTGTPLPGVAITIDPPPALQFYVTMTGAPDFGGVTIEPYTSTFGCNETPGPVHITATAPGLEFAPVDITIEAGNFTTMILMQPLM
jgi:hypothetical protein